MNITLTIEEMNELLQLLTEKIAQKKAEKCDECAERFILLKDKLLAEKLKQ